MVMGPGEQEFFLGPVSQNLAPEVFLQGRSLWEQTQAPAREMQLVTPLVKAALYLCCSLIGSGPFCNIVFFHLKERHRPFKTTGCSAIHPAFLLSILAFVQNIFLLFYLAP